MSVRYVPLYFDCLMEQFSWLSSSRAELLFAQIPSHSIRKGYNYISCSITVSGKEKVNEENYHERQCALVHMYRARASSQLFGKVMERLVLA